MAGDKIPFEWVRPGVFGLLSVFLRCYRHSASSWNHLPTRQKLRHHVKADMSTWSSWVLLGSVVQYYTMYCTYYCPAFCIHIQYCKSQQQNAANWNTRGRFQIITFIIIIIMWHHSDVKYSKNGTKQWPTACKASECTFTVLVLLLRLKM